MIDTFDNKVYLDGNDKVERFALTTPNAETGDNEPATGLVGLTVHYSLTKGGAAIHADVSESLAEYAETPGLYHATMEGSAITQRLAAILNPRIKAVVTDSGGNVKCSFDRYIVTNRAR